MKVKELLAELRDRNALIVHFSHHAKMDHPFAFPEDMQNSIKVVANRALSCSVIWPDKCISVGSVGLILRPCSDTSVTSIKPIDSASREEPDGSRVSDGLDLSPATFNETFAAPHQTYNEWTVKDAEVVGVFVMPDQQLLVKKRTPAMTFKGISIEEDIWPDEISIDEVARTFPGLPVFSFRDGKILLLRGEPTVIYP